MNHQSKKTIQVKRTVKGYWHLKNASKILLQKSVKNNEPIEDGFIPGSHYTIMASLVFSAFTFEAYLNHIGEHVKKLWEKDAKKQIRTKDKFKIVAQDLGVQIHHDKRPYRTIYELIEFRNSLAHLDTVELIKSKSTTNLNKNINCEEPQAVWEKRCTYDYAVMAYQDVIDIIEEIHSKSKDEDPLILGDYTDYWEITR